MTNFTLGLCDNLSGFYGLNTNNTDKWKKIKKEHQKVRIGDHAHSIFYKRKHTLYIIINNVM